MFRKFIYALSFAAIMISLMLPGVAAETADISINHTTNNDGIYTVHVSFSGIPEDDPVEYAQIRLCGDSNQHEIDVNSFLWLAPDEHLLVTKQFDTSACSLLVLIEPEDRLCSGLGSGPVFSFQIKQSNQTTASLDLDLAAILILKSGKELEIEREISLNIAVQPSVPTTEPTVPITTLPDQDQTDPTSDPTTAPATSPSTAPVTTPATVPSETSDPTQPSDSNAQVDGQEDSSWSVTVLIIAAGLVAIICVYLIIRKSKK